MKKITATALLAIALAAAPAFAADGASQASTASALSADGAAMVVDGSLLAAAGSGVVVVKSVEASAEALVFVVEGSANGVSATVRLSGRAAKEASLATGQMIQATTVSTGVMLVALGKVIAFIPNETGKALLHHSRVGA
ncbi:hypothetical protein [Pseudoduganella sp. GCM10020061]|uniref:hypothetical protein n=1 Tax=Pseudoduganella sp. GCM10020061 TaxID=3317345 RepID=UPI00363F9953